MSKNFGPDYAFNKYKPMLHSPIDMVPLMKKIQPEADFSPLLGRLVECVKSLVNYKIKDWRLIEYVNEIINLTTKYDLRITDQWTQPEKKQDYLYKIRSAAAYHKGTDQTKILTLADMMEGIGAQKGNSYLSLVAYGMSLASTLESSPQQLENASNVQLSTQECADFCANFQLGTLELEDLLHIKTIIVNQPDNAQEIARTIMYDLMCSELPLNAAADWIINYSELTSEQRNNIVLAILEKFDPHYVFNECKFAFESPIQLVPLMRRIQPEADFSPVLGSLVDCVKSLVNSNIKDRRLIQVVNEIIDLTTDYGLIITDQWTQPEKKQDYLYKIRSAAAYYNETDQTKILTLANMMECIGAQKGNS